MRIVAIVSLSVFLLPVPASAQSTDILKFDIHAVDKAADACADFYQYACGNWLKRNPIPADRSYSALFEQMRDLNQKRVDQILQHAASAPATSEDRKIGDYYASCMDERAIEAKGLEPMQAELARIDAIRDPHTLATEIARLHQFGTDALFSMSADQKLEDATKVIAYLDQSGLNLPEPGYYTSNEPEMVKAREEYRAHLEDEFILLGQDKQHAKAAADDVMKIEVELATAELTPVERRNRRAWYHLMALPGLKKLVPDFSWETYFAAIGFRPGEMNVAVPQYMQALEKLLKAISMQGWKNYLRWALIRIATPALPQRFREAEFDFYQHTLAGVKQQASRSQQCTDLTDRDLGQAVGKEYQAQYFPASSKQKVLEMVDHIEQALRNDIEQSTWMDASTKREALHKLELLRPMIGYPDHWRDYSGLEVRRSDALGNTLRAQEFEFRRQLAKIGKPVDRGEFYEEVQSVSGYHDNSQNVIVFTAGILQPPFFDPQMDDAVNFGLAGAVIGHELSHAFDDKGHLFDGEGNMRNWWTTADTKNYEGKAACLVQQYSQYPVVDDVKVNGQLTLGENIADNGGLQLAYMAFESAPHSNETVDGYTPEQRFFLGWAQWRCMNVTDAEARQLARNDPHSPGRWRVNGVVSNMPVFAKAYGCKQGDAMVRAEPCGIW